MRSPHAFPNVCKALGDYSLVEWVRIHLFSGAVWSRILES